MAKRDVPKFKFQGVMESLRGVEEAVQRQAIIESFPQRVFDVQQLVLDISQLAEHVHWQLWAGCLAKRRRGIHLGIDCE